jgi:MYXO-CTERM domain-containing protein
VALALGGGASGARLTGGDAIAAAGGIATFDKLAIDRAGAAFSLTASSDGLASATSDPFDIAAAPSGHGGCSSGPAGCLALLGLAALLRRRRHSSP